MSSVIEERNILIQNNIPKLIKALTGFNVKDENYKSCLQFVHSTFKYHRNIAVNPFEVKRNVDALCEKFRFSNFHEIEKIFKKLVEESVSHELAVNHYEKDAMYSILNLLITLAYDPIRNLKKCLREGKPIIEPVKIELRRSDRRSRDNFISLLLKDNFTLPHNETDSELSEWTSSEDENESALGHSSDDSIDENSCRLISPNALQPPKKPIIFTTEIIENSEKWLKENVQSPWWKDEKTIANIPSNHIVANFNKVWQKHLTERSMGFIKPKNLSLVTEYCLLREIFWMFINPVDCKFFKIDANDDIRIRPDVSLPSLMPESLQIFLKQILRSMNYMRRLKHACKVSQDSGFSSHTFETYHKILKTFLDKICEFILEQEDIVREQKVVYTIIVFNEKFHIHARFLEMLWIIHSTSILDEDDYEPYKCASYLLSSLNNHISASTEKSMKNLAIVFLVNCLQSYFTIFDMWWSEARFVDHRKEFLMEMIDNFEDNIEVTRPRLVMAKARDRTMEDDTSRKILDDRLMSMMLSFANKASFTFEIINKMDRANEIRQLAEDHASMYEEFYEKVQDEIRSIAQFKVEKEEVKEGDEKTSKNQNLIDEIKAEMIKNGDDIMLLALESTFQQLEKPTENLPKQREDFLEFYDFLNKSTDFLLLPVESVIEKNLKILLASKISISEKFLREIFFNELHVDKLIKDMRKVYFLSSNEVVNLFNEKIFKEVDKNDDKNLWANSYTLTTSLNDAITTGMHFDNSMNYIVKVNKKCSYKSVIDAINELFIRFNVDQNLNIVFTSSVIHKYNQVFRFLLKIKYSQLILNNLRFPDFFKNRLPYASYQLIDIVIKRLCITRFGILQKINYLYSHLMTMIDGLTFILDEKIQEVESVSEFISLHENFIDAVHKNSLNTPETSTFNAIIIETLNLAKAVKETWRCVEIFAALDEAGNLDEVDSSSLYDLDKQAIQIEKNFGVCEYQLKIMFDNFD